MYGHRLTAKVAWTSEKESYLPGKMWTRFPIKVNMLGIGVVYHHLSKNIYLFGL